MSYYLAILLHTNISLCTQNIILYGHLCRDILKITVHVYRDMKIAEPWNWLTAIDVVGKKLHVFIDVVTCKSGNYIKQLRNISWQTVNVLKVLSTLSTIYTIYSTVHYYITSPNNHFHLIRILKIKAPAHTVYY